MSEELINRYNKLSIKLEQRWQIEMKKIDETLKSYEEQWKRSLAQTARKELDLMEGAIEKGRLSEAEYHKLMAQTYLSLIK
jgi:hypothetical protein